MSYAYLLNEVSYSYRGGPERLLDIPNLLIERESRVFIEGESGSGKSTLLSLLAGVLTPTKGTVSLLHNRNFSSLKSSKRDAIRAKNIGFIFQMFNLLPFLSVLENVMLGLQFSPERRAKVSKKCCPKQEARRLLSELGLIDEKLYTRQVAELSVGQQQRVSAARALIGAPAIVIADEPTSALDSSTRDSFLKLLINECTKANSTLIFVSHDSSLSSHFDKTIEMNTLSGIAPASFNKR